MIKNLSAPFPWFGGKRKAAAEVWQRFGNVKNYVEPFFGSGAVLLARPDVVGNETINDLDGFVANFWRAIRLSPSAVAEHASHPVNENDLHARHAWLVSQRASMAPRLEGDPDWHDPKIAGWWVWGTCCWIGSGFCAGKGPWEVVDGELVNRKLVHLGDNGRGVNRKLVHLGDNGQKDALEEWFSKLSTRLSRVRVASGDWARVCGPSVTHKRGMTAVFLDPPYADTADRTDNVYAEDSSSVAHDVREWAIENGARKDMRIALCGYDGEHKMPDDWSVFQWSAGEGFGGQAKERAKNGERERIWFSPACLGAKKSAQVGLFGDEA